MYLLLEYVLFIINLVKLKIYNKYSDIIELSFWCSVYPKTETKLNPPPPKIQPLSHFK